jgi:phenylalanine-4-hydroxylase
MRTDYLIDDYQQTYFVLDSFEQLFHAGYDTDFAPLYARYAGTPGFAANCLQTNDTVLTHGSQSR